MDISPKVCLVSKRFLCASLSYTPPEVEMPFLRPEGYLAQPRLELDASLSCLCLEKISYGSKALEGMPGAC